MLPRWRDRRPYLADVPDLRWETRNPLHKLHNIRMSVTKR